MNNLTMADVMDLTMSDSDDEQSPIDLTADTPPKEEPNRAPVVSAKESPMGLSIDPFKAAEKQVDSTNPFSGTSTVDGPEETDEQLGQDRVRTKNKWTQEESDLLIELYNVQIQQEKEDPTKSRPWSATDKQVSLGLLDKGYHRTPKACGQQFATVQQQQGLVKPTPRRRKSIRGSEIKDEDDPDAVREGSSSKPTQAWSDAEKIALRDLIQAYTMLLPSERVTRKDLWQLMVSKMEEKGFHRNTRSLRLYWHRTGRDYFGLDERKFVTDPLESSFSTASVIPKVEKPNELSKPSEAISKPTQKGQQPASKKLFTPEQRQELFNEYDKNPTPSKETIQGLANKFKDSFTRVQAWFANSRSKERLGKVQRRTGLDGEQLPQSNDSKLKRTRERKFDLQSPIKKDVYEVDTDDDDDTPLIKRPRVENKLAKSKAPDTSTAERPKPPPIKYNEAGNIIRKAPIRDPSSVLHVAGPSNTNSARQYASPYTPQAAEMLSSPLIPTPSLPPKLPNAPKQAAYAIPQVPAPPQSTDPATPVLRIQAIRQQAASTINNHPAVKPTSAGLAIPAVPVTPENGGPSNVISGPIAAAHSSAKATTLKLTATSMIADVDEKLEKLKKEEAKQLATLSVIEKDLNVSSETLAGLKQKQVEEMAGVIESLKKMHVRETAELIQMDKDLKLAKQTEEAKLAQIQNGIQREVEGKSHLERVCDHPY